MKGRVMSFTLKREHVAEAAKRWPGYAVNFKGKGLLAMYMMVDEATCEALSVTIWESEAAMKANEARTDLRDHFRSFEPYYDGAPSWRYFDVRASLT